jgi:hypothetical protein
LLGRDLPHRIIRKSGGDYVVGAVHTNTIEGFWSILKRGVVGTYHKVSKKYLPLYVAEFQFRYNSRENVDIFGSADSRLLRHGHWQLSQLEKKVASELEWKQLELPLWLTPADESHYFDGEQDRSEPSDQEGG